MDIIPQVGGSAGGQDPGPQLPHGGALGLVSHRLKENAPKPHACPRELSLVLAAGFFGKRRRQGSVFPLAARTLPPPPSPAVLQTWVAPEKGLAVQASVKPTARCCGPLAQVR